MNRALLRLALAATVSCAAPPAAQPKRHVDLWPAPQQEALPASKFHVAIDCVLLRSHPLGARALAALAAQPEWRQFTQGTSLDPVHDVDNIVVTGPSLTDARRDAVAIRYAARDENVERAVIALTSQRTGADSSDSSIDVGVPSVKGWRQAGVGSGRTFLLGAHHVLVVAPSKHANAYARELANGALDRGPVDGAALTLRATSPSRSWSYVPEELVELRARVAPRPDGGAELFAEGDFLDEASAARAAPVLEKRLQLIASGGAEGSRPPIVIESRLEGRSVKAHIVVPKADLESLFDYVMPQLRATPP